MNDDQARELLDRLGLLVVSRPTPVTALLVRARRARVRRRRLRVATAVAGTALAVVVGASAFGSGPFDRADGPVVSDPSPTPGAHGAHTGKQPSDKEDLRLGGPGERLDPSGDDFEQVVLDVTADIPFPSDEARTISAHFQYDDLHDETGTLVSTGALRGFVANDAICSWANAWAAAVGSGEADARRAATQALQGATSWAAVTDLDPTIGRHTRFWFLTGVQEAAVGDDPQAMGKALATNVFCLPALVPDLPQALPSGGGGP